jgi:hypothetical protein
MISRHRKECARERPKWPRLSLLKLVLPVGVILSV